MLFFGVQDKGECIDSVISKLGLQSENVVSMGDDIPDLAMFSRSAYCITVPGAVDSVKQKADYITGQAGGYGAVREAVDTILVEACHEFIK